jgi:hypothetical protein
MPVFCPVAMMRPACSGQSASDFAGRSRSSPGLRTTESENPDYPAILIPFRIQFLMLRMYAHQKAAFLKGTKGD